MFFVMRYYHMIRSGISFKVNEIAIELWQKSYDSEDNKSSTTISFCDEDEDESGHLDNVEDIFEYNDDISDKDKDIKHPTEDESDSLLVAYDVDSIASMWNRRRRKQPLQ